MFCSNTSYFLLFLICQKCKDKQRKNIFINKNLTSSNCNTCLSFKISTSSRLYHNKELKTQSSNILSQIFDIR